MPSPNAALQSQVEGIAERFSGTIDVTENWGRRRLAYEIGPHKEGLYTLVQFTGTPELVKELDRRLKVTDLVIRHLIVRLDEEAKAAAQQAARRDEAAGGDTAQGTGGDTEVSKEPGQEKQAEA